ncbi:MAG: hypothetical protein J2P40_01045 [Candidatus Dormibacteraeota bacterium]|nr:hypothetical protein [Candidatus Dormibacteraeota bacterium]MBO0759834.1 hypothetical protein [Candidatus Dormibacteraeota bacterium]
MTTDRVEAIVRAVLYEGYLLYPYTRTAAKNQVRWTFGGVYPPAWAADPSTMQTECLVVPDPECHLQVQVRCLQLVRRTGGGEPAWQEAVERTAVDRWYPLPDLAGDGKAEPVHLPGGHSAGGDGVDRVWRSITGHVRCRAVQMGDRAHRLTVGIENTTPAPPEGLDRDAALLRTLVSTHTILRVRGGAFVSQTDPPAHLREAAAFCDNRGTWPVLAGEPGAQDTVLSSPIILEDHPRVAEESPGDLFDATEIDEILTLRILTLSDDEKDELRRTDERARDLLDRTESLGGDDLLRLHGTLREIRPLSPWPEDGS